MDDDTYAVLTEWKDGKNVYLYLDGVYETDEEAERRMDMLVEGGVDARVERWSNELRTG